MEYMLLLYVDEAAWPRLTKAQQEEGVASYGAYRDALQKAGVFKDSHRLQPSSSAAMVRMANGKAQRTDGPYAETKEQIGGYFVIDVPDQKAALEWAARCPAASHGVVEVRPFAPMPPA